MYRASLRSIPRAAHTLRSTQSSSLIAPTCRRWASSSSSSSPGRKGTWKGAAVRWGAAAGALYWYNTSPIFADEVAPQTVSPPPEFSTSDLPTVEAVVEEKRKQMAASSSTNDTAGGGLATEPSSPSSPQSDGEASGAPSSPEELEEEAGQEAAFNPETGEINWDCPCLGGMAHGPCGEEFKAAFSCFVYSTEEPKGMDCIDKFQHMQDCFRQYPEIYGAEIADEGADGEESETGEIEAGSPLAKPAPADGQAVASSENVSTPKKGDADDAAAESLESTHNPSSATRETPKETQMQVKATAPPPAEDVMTPKKAFDATEQNNKQDESK